MNHLLSDLVNREKTKKIFFYLFVAIAVLWAIPLINRGIDVTDTGYYLAKYKYVFDSSVDIRSGTILFTEIIGGLLYRLTEQYQMLVLNISTWMCYLISVFLVYKLLKREKSDIYVLCMCIIGTMYSFSWIKAFNYNTLSMFIQLLAILFLLYAIKIDKNCYLVISGILLGINVFVRIPNVLQFAYALCICRAYGIRQKKWKCAGKKILYFVFGSIVGVLFSFITVLLFIGSDSFVNMVRNLFSEVGDTNSGHGLNNMLERVFEGIERGVQMWSGKLLVVVAGVSVLFASLKKRSVKIQKCGFYIATLLFCVLAIRWGLGFQSAHIMYEMIAVFLIISSFAFLFIDELSAFESSLALLVLISELILTIGTDNGWYYQSVFMIFPFASVMTIWSKYIHAFATEKYLKIVVCFVFFVISSFGIKYAFTNVYRDAPYDELVANVEIPVCKGMKTTIDKAEALESLDKQLMIYEGIYDSLVVLGDCPIVYTFTDLKPCLSQSWPDLQSFSYEQFQEEIDDKFSKGEYPLVLFANFDQDGYAMMDENKKQYMLEVMDENQYMMVFRNSYYSIYAPNSLV